MSSYSSYRDQFEEAFRYGVASLPFYTIGAISAGVLAMMMCCSVSRQRDPARSYLNWLRCAFGIFVLYSFFQTVNLALYVTQMRLYLDGFGATSRSMIVRASSYLGFVGVLFGTWSDILLILTLVSIGVCVCDTRRGIASSGSKVVQGVSFGAGFVLWVLAVARFAMACRANALGSSQSIIRAGVDVNRLQLAVTVLLLVLAVVMSGWSVVIKTKAKAVQKPDMPSTYLLVCSMLFLLASAYNLGVFVQYVYLDIPAENKSYDRYIDALDIVFSYVPSFVILVLLFVLSRKQAGGLWSLPGVAFTSNQPAMPQQPAWGQPQMYMQYQPPPQQVHPGWNQQQFQPAPPHQTGPIQSSVPPQEMYGGTAPTWHEMPQPSYREHAGTKLAS